MSLNLGEQQEIQKKDRQSRAADLSNVYHFTDTGRLPWILDTSELRPCRMKKLGGFPDDFLWATTNENGAQTASVFYEGSGYKEGQVWLIRFTLSATDFEPWPEATKRNPAWTKAHIERLNGNLNGDNPADWWTSCGSLGRSKWLSIHARSYLHPVWREIPRGLVVHAGTHPAKGFPIKTIMWGGRAFSSMRTSENPRMAYTVRIVDMLAEAQPQSMVA